MLKTISFTLLSIFISCAVQAQDTISFSITSIHRGKNIYVQNPFYKDSLFCTCQVNVNQQKKLGYVNSSSYEIDLSSLQIGDTVTIQIVHYKTCKPKILNPYTGHSRPLVFKTFSAWGNTIIWTTYPIKGKGIFYVEHFEYNSWVNKKEVAYEAKGKGDTLFTADVHSFSGVNKYRLKYVADNGEVSYSKIDEVDFEIEKLKIKIDSETKKIFFSRENEFYILDERGQEVLRGFDVEQDISKLASGVYYLNADNVTKKFSVKK